MGGSQRPCGSLRCLATRVVVFLVVSRVCSAFGLLLGSSPFGGNLLLKTGSTKHQSSFSSSSSLRSSSDDGGLEEAKQLLKLAKAKLALQKEGVAQGASESIVGESDDGDAEKKIKLTTDQGIVCDSNYMVAKSEEEEWESRGIDDMFVDITDIVEGGESGDVVVDAERREKWRKLRERDVANTILSLRQQLNADDFDKIFDQRNPRIGQN